MNKKNLFHQQKKIEQDIKQKLPQFQKLLKSNLIRSIYL